MRKKIFKSKRHKCQNSMRTRINWSVTQCFKTVEKCSYMTPLSTLGMGVRPIVRCRVNLLNIDQNRNNFWPREWIVNPSDTAFSIAPIKNTSTQKNKRGWNNGIIIQWSIHNFLMNKIPQNKHFHPILVILM